MMGFRRDITSLLTSTVADITVASPYAERQPELHPITDDNALRQIISASGSITHIERYALRGGVLRSENGSCGIVVKGVGNEAELSFYSSRLISGESVNIEEQRRKELLISESVATKLGISNGSRIELLLIEGNTPRRELFKVGGIYRSALGDVGAELALTDIRNVQKLNGWSAEQISGYACRVENSDYAQAVADKINLRLLYEYEGEEGVAAITSNEKYADIFGWLETHDVNAVVILTIMLVVAIFNIVTALLILVLERTRMIGTLKSMGMQNSCIRKIFTYRASKILLRGLAIGNGVAIVLLLLQQHLHIVKLDEAGYFLSTVPVALGVWWMVGLNLLFIAVIIGVVYLATSIIQRIDVADAIKYN